MKLYHTEQREQLLAFLHAHADRAYTAEELAEQLGGSPALSTVYRLVNRLAEEGDVRRLCKDGSRRFLYQATGGAACRSHLHLQCTACGRLIHLDDDTSEAMRQMLDSADFEVDEGKTVLLGHCRTCRGKETRS